MEKEKIMLEKKGSNVVDKFEYNNEEFNYQVTTTREDSALKRTDVAIYTIERHEYAGTMGYGDNRFSSNLNVLEDNIKHIEIFNEIYKLVSEEVVM